MPRLQFLFKRFFDIAFSTLALLVSSPFLLLVFLALKLENSKAPVLFVQERVGEKGSIFKMYKFRSMITDAEDETGPILAIENDSRVTPVGKFLRRTRLDEWPQFLNVLKGEMSVVGPRPERPFFVERFSQEVPAYSRRLEVKPGITGPAQVEGSYDSPPEEKLKRDLYYVQHHSPALDIKVVLQTILVVLSGKGAR
jgi:exopolysaccharide biosynthesis polyprenyl glycosylphosphotransferase